MSDRDGNGQVTGDCPDDYTMAEQMAYIRGQVDMLARLADIQIGSLAAAITGRGNGHH